MRLNERLNLVLKVDCKVGTVYVHSIPINAETFDLYYRPLAKVMADIGNDGLGMNAGPRVTFLLLRDAAKQLGVWEGEQGIERGLLPEIRRLTNVLMFQNGVWGQVPFEKAITDGFFDQGDQREVENAIIFFTVLSHMGKKVEKPILLPGFASQSGMVTTSLNCTEYGASLPTSTETENTGVKATQSSIPS